MVVNEVIKIRSSGRSQSDRDGIINSLLRCCSRVKDHTVHYADSVNRNQFVYFFHCLLILFHLNQILCKWVFLNVFFRQWFTFIIRFFCNYLHKQKTSNCSYNKNNQFATEGFALFVKMWTSLLYNGLHINSYMCHYQCVLKNRGNPFLLKLELGATSA